MTLDDGVLRRLLWFEIRTHVLDEQDAAVYALLAGEARQLADVAAASRPSVALKLDELVADLERERVARLCPINGRVSLPEPAANRLAKLRRRVADLEPEIEAWLGRVP